MGFELHEGRLSEYYNEELQMLEHFRYKGIFIRGKKNVFFSFVPKEFVDTILRCRTVSASSFKRRTIWHGFSSVFQGLRDYFTTFMVHHGLLQQEVDLLQGRIGRTLFMKHYFSPEIGVSKAKTLSAIQHMLSQLNQKTSN